MCACADRLWRFLSRPQSDKVFRVLANLHEDLRRSNWLEWLGLAEDERKAAFFMQCFAHTIRGRPVARYSEIPGTGGLSPKGMTWGDAETDGFVLQRGLRHMHFKVQGSSCICNPQFSLSHLPACLSFCQPH